MDYPPIEQSCYWLAQRHRDPDPPLEQDAEADVAVVGAGFTGLWAAHFLKELSPQTEIRVLEARTTAYGATGRNAGMLGEELDHSLEMAIAHFGREEAVLLARLGVENLGEILSTLSTRGIDCDLEVTGQLVVGLSDAHVEDLEAAEACARELGLHHYRLLRREEAQERLHSPLYHGGLLNPHNALVDPVKLAEGLRKDAAQKGIRFHENSPVQSLERDGAAVRVRCPRGSVRAKKVVLGLSAYTHHLVPAVTFRFLPLYDYILVSEPLREEQRGAIGWKDRFGVADERTFFNYYRLTKDDRVLFGTSEAMYYPPNRVDESCDHSERHYAELERSFHRHFPAVGPLAFPYRWGGAICATTRFTPFFDQTLGGAVHYCLGYTGHGLGLTHLGGKVLAHQVLGRPSPLLELGMVRHKPFPYPPEPLRRLAVSAVTRSLRRVDAGGRPGPLLRLLDFLGIGLSS